MRTIAHALIAHTRGKAIPDYAELARASDFYSPARRDLAAQHYLSKRAAERAQRNARNVPAAIVAAGCVAAIIFGGLLIVSGTNSDAAKAGLAFALAGCFGLFAIIAAQ